MIALLVVGVMIAGFVMLMTLVLVGARSDEIAGRSATHPDPIVDPQSKARGPLGSSGLP